MMSFFRPAPRMVGADEALPGRPEPVEAMDPRHQRHLALDVPLAPPPDAEVIYLAAGCFWGVERIFWRMPGVVTTAAGYMGGFTPHPTYEETCTGRTGHAETVLVAFDPAHVGVDRLVATFFENHDPTTPNRQGNDIGTQYRSAVYWTSPAHAEAVLAARDAFADVLAAAGHGAITTELRPAQEAGPFYYAEPFHQQYLHRIPNGYCNHGPNGYSCPTALV